MKIIFFTWRELKRSHQAMEMCAGGEERKQKQLLGEEVQRSMAVDFQAYGRPFVAVS